ncbi:DivIVA domain-containing protein [Paratractidigestivibacter sp.]|uniref:DivIVA domain-containing protein n=1 Tax=Paratractidigestivibacter sp. TaxID=2847316 RepID=UPI002ABDBE11|nr:DivIVA domain-containing protein [Paratractidigestivibacter sp.]
MVITPADIEQQTFSPSKHGYDTEEVDKFLDTLSGEVDAMLQKIADLKSRLITTEQQLADSQAEVQSLQEQVDAAAVAPQAASAVPDPEPVQNTMHASEHQISRVLIAAQQSADKLVEEARNDAERILNDADTKAREVIRQAFAEKQNELDEIDRLKSSREEFRTEYKKLLQHFMDDAESVFPARGSSGSGLYGLSGTTHSDVAAASVAVSASVQQGPAQATVSGLGDFGDLD